MPPIIARGKNQHLAQIGPALEGLVHNGNGVGIAAGVDDLHVERNIRVDELFTPAHGGFMVLR